jgi:hypothetical protein
MKLPVVSETTILRTIRVFKKHAIVLHRDTEYELSQDMKDIREFLIDYCSYFAVSGLNKISSDGRFITAQGNIYYLLTN